MPATVLDVLQEDGTYPNLYYGMNLATEVPQGPVETGLVVSHELQGVPREQDLLDRFPRH